MEDIERNTSFILEIASTFYYLTGSYLEAYWLGYLEA